MELPCVVHSDRLHHVMEGLSFSQRERLLECWALSLSPVEGISLTRSPYHLQRYHIPEPVLWPKVAVSGQKLPEKKNLTLFIQSMQRYSAMRRTWAAV